jgi:hypothetical protein
VAVRLAQAAVEDREVEAAGQAGKDGLDAGEDAADLLHVPAHEDVGQACRRRELADVLVGRLRPFAERQGGAHECLGRPAAQRDELAGGEGLERRPHGGLALREEVPPHEAGVGLGQLDERLAGAEVGHPDGLHAAVGPAAAEDGQVEHQYTPSTTVAWSFENGRTFRAPSHG